jgi:hypothetical protein
LQGILVPLVVRDDGDVFELVAGFHRVAAAKSVGLAEVPVVVREAQTEDADRAVENITSCRRRHDVIYADRVVIPMSELTCATVRREPAGEVGIRTRTDPGSRLRHTIWLKWRLPLDSESEHAIRTRRHARDSSNSRVGSQGSRLSHLPRFDRHPQRLLTLACRTEGVAAGVLVPGSELPLDQVLELMHRLGIGAVVRRLHADIQVAADRFRTRRPCPR